MQLTYNNKTIDIFRDREPEHIGISLSGGLDSASLLYIIVKYFRHIKITPIIAIDANARMDALCALDVIGFVQDTFLDHSIQPTESFHFDHRDPYWLKKAQRLHDAGSTIQEVALRVSGTSKNIQMANGVNNIRKVSFHEYEIFGLTSNPPDDVMKERGFFDIAEPSRNEPHNRPYNKSYPYINVDKKFIAEIYKTEGLMETLYHITRSCVGMKGATDYGIKECGCCFWCYEKKWGFE